MVKKSTTSMNYQAEINYVLATSSDHNNIYYFPHDDAVLLKFMHRGIA